MAEQSVIGVYMIWYKRKKPYAGWIGVVSPSNRYLSLVKISSMRGTSRAM